MGTLLWITLVACMPDADGDGTPDDEDCRPTDASVHADAEEVCDGDDNDCDGRVDEGWYADGDEDGWGSDPWDCSAETPYATVGGDCDDDDPAVSPGEAETAYKGRDDDCDEATPDDDLDADGFLAAEDCDDEDPSVTPDTLVTHEGNATFPDDDLDGVNVVTGNLAIDPGVSSLDGLESLCAVGGVLGLTGLTAVEDLGPLSRLRTVGYLYVQALPRIRDLEGLAGVRTVTEHVALAQITLDDLSGLRGLRSAGGMWLYDVDIQSIAGLDALTTLGYFEAVDTTLPNLDGFPPVPSLAAELHLVWNARLDSLAGLSALTSVGSLDVHNNALQTLDGLDAIVWIAGDAYVSADAPDLDALSALQVVEGTLELQDNSALVDLSGLYGLTRVGGDLVIEDNPSLAQAEIDALLEVLGESVVEGDVATSGNGG